MNEELPTSNLTPNQQQEFSSSDVHLEEGILSVDIYNKDNIIVIVSPVAGASKESIEIIVQGDILIIKGQRVPPESVSENEYYRKECYWGPFSRTIVLPKNVDKNNIRAVYENGILMIRIPRVSPEDSKKVFIE